MIGRKLLGQSSFACFIAAISGCAFATQASPGGSCTHPAEVLQEAVVSAPAYVPDSEATADPEKDAAQALWRDYQVSVFDGLSRSPDPRDWALATLTDVLQFDPGSQNQFSQDRRKALLQRASRAAPDDVLVQWIASLSHSDDAGAAALHALQRIEADNAAVWQKVLTEAILQKNKAAVDAALHKMSASVRFDLHHAELVQALTAAYQRYRMPESYAALAPKQQWQPSERVIPFVNAMSITAAVAFPAFQTLLQACRVNQATGENASRAGDCAMIGRVMTRHSDSFLANRIGFAILRVSRTFSDDDVQVARNQNWIYAQYGSIAVDWMSPESTDEIVAFHKDWLETRNEPEAMRRAIVRSGKPEIPPDGWVDDQSPFSAERLRADETRLRKEAPAH